MTGTSGSAAAADWVDSERVASRQSAARTPGAGQARAFEANVLHQLRDINGIIVSNERFTELPERESPLLQLWDESEVKPGVSSDTLMV